MEISANSQNNQISESTERAKRILLVEDEPHLAFNMGFNLQAEGYEVIPAANGQIALEKFRTVGPFDLIILDIMIPEVNGFEVAKIIRSTDKITGILILTAMSAEADIVTGLEAGADDYMTKPFQLKELLLRVKRMAERSSLFAENRDKALQGSIRSHRVKLDLDSLHLESPRGHFELTVLEAKLLAELLNHAGKVLTRDHLLKKVWGLSGQVETRTVDNFILRLRKYMEIDPSKPCFLKSVRGRGYRFEDK